eukprot:2326913-Prymnesium_polylepis.1
MSGEQMSAYSSLRGNLGAEGDGTPIGTMGPLMCTLSLLVWTITNVRTRGATATMLDEDGGLLVKSVSPQRFGGLLAVQLVRLATAALLLIYGCVRGARCRLCLVCSTA